MRTDQSHDVLSASIVIIRSFNFQRVPSMNEFVVRKIASSQEINCNVIPNQKKNL